MQIVKGNWYRFDRERLAPITVKVIDYKPFSWVLYASEGNEVVRGSCTVDYFLERAAPAAHPNQQDKGS